MPDKRILEGKVALITGGASGIGRATALLFAGNGAAVAVADLNDHAGQIVAEEIMRNGGRALFERADVTNVADCKLVVANALRHLGPINILFNNAGIIRRATVLELSVEDWDLVMAVNVKSMFLMSRLVIPVMVQAGGGSIIHMASGWELAGGPLETAVSEAPTYRGRVLSLGSGYGHLGRTEEVQVVKLPPVSGTK